MSSQCSSSADLKKNLNIDECSSLIQRLRLTATYYGRYVEGKVAACRGNPTSSTVTL